MEPIAQVMRFGSDIPRLDATALLAIAAASAIGVALLAWLIFGTAGPPGVEVLGLPIAVVMAVCGIYFGGSWSQVEVDAAKRMVTERHGFLGHTIGLLSQQRGFDRISGVLVERRIAEETRNTGTSMSPGTRKVHHTTYAVSLMTGETRVQAGDRVLSTPNLPIGLPGAEGADPVAMETLARRLASLGDWPALRYHYKLQAPQAGSATPDNVVSAAGEYQPISRE